MYVRAPKCTHQGISKTWSHSFCARALNFESLIKLLVIGVITVLRRTNLIKFVKLS